MAINRSTLRLLRRLQVTVGTEADAAVRSLTNSWVRSWDELSGAWQVGVQDAVAKAAASGKWPSAWELARTERLRQATLASEEALLKLGEQTGVTVADGAGQVIAATADLEPALIASQLPAAEQAAAAARFAANVAPTVLSAMTARTQSQIVATSRPLSGAASEAMRRELVRGIAVGTNPRQAASAMVARVQGAFEGGLVRAVTIARTEMLDAYRATSTLTHAANGDVVSAWIWHADLGPRCCPACWSMHGRVFPADVPGPWGHPQCRCARLPKTRTWRELGFNIDEPADTVVNARTRFFKLPHADQRTIMGPGRLELLRSGRVDWADLSGLRVSKEWRPSYAPSAVRDLERLGRARASLTDAERIAKIAADQHAQLEKILADQHARAQALFADVHKRFGERFGTPPLPSVAATPAAVVADPALKMTVAQLKAIAKDNGVPLYRATTKNDIIWQIRQWESDKLKSGGKVLLPDGPIGKPITFGLKAIDAPPLGVPPTGKPVLTGSALNDWADHFKYDLQYGRHQFVDKAGDTAAEGVRVKDLRALVPAGGFPEYVVAEGTAWRFNGVAYLIEHGPRDYGAPWVSRALTELRAAHDSIPAAVKANKSYAVLRRGSPQDPYWQARFNNPNHTAAMSAGHGHINIWNFNPNFSRIERQIDDLRHETGHNLDALYGHTSRQPIWSAAADADAVWAAKIRDLTPTHHEATDLARVEPTRGWPKGVTKYGRSSEAEDFAESVMLYQLGPIATGRIGSEAGRALYFRDIYPKRAAILDKRFPEIAKAQQAEIAALRSGVPAAAPDLSKLTVAQLRAQAKERGIKIPTGSKKADIVALLKPPPTLTPAQRAAAEKAAQRAAARERSRQIEQATGTAKLLAHTDELIAKKADLSVIRAALDPKLIGPEQLFANADPAILAALRKAAGSGVTALRAAVTRASTKAKIKPISKAGTKVKFDPDTMEPFAGDIKAGTQVTVVTRGSSVTLPDGTVLQLTKAKVQPVVKTRPPAMPTPIRDLIDADDATIKATLRDVYEGKFGPYTTKVEVHITRAGTQTLKSGRQRKIEQSISVEGKIYDSAGHEIGDFSRSIGPVEMHYGGVVRREIWAEHKIVQLDPKYQGKGFGTEFNRRAINWYRASKVYGIGLSDHNGYVWASQGFDFANGIMPDHKVEELRDLVAALRAGRTRDKYNATIPKQLREAPNLDAQLSAADALLKRATTIKPGKPGYPTAYEVSQLGRASGQSGKTATWLGKYLKVSAEQMILNPDEFVVIA